MASAAARLRILCFHSFRFSGASMQTQLTTFSNLGAVLAELADLDFIDGAHRAPDDALPENLRQIFPPPHYEFWNARETEEGVVYDHLDESLAKIKEHIAANGPFDGYLGFSQGGSVAHLLSLLSLRGPNSGVPPPRFGVFLSARATRHAAHAELVASAVQTPMPLPSLVLYGGQDTDVPPGQTREMMATLAPDLTTEVFLPTGGHRIPKLSEEHASTVRRFLTAQLAAKSIS